MKVVAIIQARMGSSRLPGKVMLPIVGKPMLQHVVERVRLAVGVDSIVVATTVSTSDDPIVEWCKTYSSVNFIRGSEDDVLKRFLDAAYYSGADVVIRITADCPLIDPQVIEKGLAEFNNHDVDYVSNTINYTYPDGLDVEIFKIGALEIADKHAVKPSDREHVTPYLRNSGKFKIKNFISDIDYGTRQLRWTVDEFDDLEYIREIYRHFSPNSAFTLNEIISAIDNKKIRAKHALAILNEGYYKSLYNEAVEGAARSLNLSKTNQEFKKICKVIPGGAQTFSKGYTQHVLGVSPLVLSNGKGSKVWDLDDNQYIDYIQGLLPNILGYACEEVDQAFFTQACKGHSYSLAHPLERLLAEKLCDIIPCAEMVRFGKNGSDATAGSIRMARAYTSRDRVACCGYHGWQDWYIGSTTRNIGVPKGVRDLTHTFPYNDSTALSELLESHPGEFAAVIMEPVNFVEPHDGYLQKVKEITHKHGAILIFDEICTGFHQGLGGAQKRLGITPDLACFGKAMGNGYPISCICGNREIMKTCEDIFFSFTFGGEVASMAAALKVIEILETTPVLSEMRSRGQKLKDGFDSLVKLAGLSNVISIVGNPTWSLIKYKSLVGSDGMIERSLLQQEMVKRGVLSLVTHNISGAHTDSDIDNTLEAYASCFKTLARWFQDSNPERFLEGKMIQPVFNVR